MSKRVRPWIALSIVTVTAFWIAAPSSALLVTDEVANAAQQSEQLLECSAEGWTDELAQESALELSGVKPCRPCRDREWCTCSYSGGGTRVSCNPCCYQQYDGQIICLD